MKRVVVLLMGVMLGLPLMGQSADIDGGLASGGLASGGLESGEADGRGLYLAVGADAFVCDAEYFLPRSKGYTYVGTRLVPTLRYVANPKVALRGGVMLTALAGYQGLWKAEPVLTLDFTPTPWLRLLMGTIESDARHRLAAPLSDPNRWYYAYKEEGVQLLTHTAHWESDSWLDWEHFLTPWTADQERFTLGTRHEIYLFDRRQREAQRWQVSLPLAFTGSHRGGQVTTLDTCIETIFNEQAGLRADWHGEIMQFGVEVPLYLYQNGSPSGERRRPYDRGWGVWPCAEASAQWGGNRMMLTAGYWRGSQFLSVHGNPLFMSVSDHDATVQPDVRMATLALAYTYRYKAFLLGVTAKAYHDTDLGKTDLDFGLIMRLNIGGKKLM